MKAYTPEELGRIAVSLRGWRWMRGMSALENDENRELMVWGPCGEAVYEDANGCPEFTMIEGSDLPDPTDPATAGCLLQLLGAGASWLQMTTWAPDCARATPTAWRVGNVGPLDLGSACIIAAKIIECWPGGDH